MRTALFLISILVCGPLAAQTVTVRSGEHGAFTRLAFDLPPLTRWTLSPDTGTGLRELRFDPRPERLDTDAVFDRIDRARVSDIRVAPDGSIALDIACPCEVDSFMQGPRMLVLDIFESPETDPQPASGASVEELEIEPAAEAGGPAIDLTSVTLAPLPRMGPVLRPSVPPFDPVEARRALETIAPPLEQTGGLDIVAAVAESAGAGVLELADTYDPAPSPPQPEQPERAPFDATTTTRALDGDRLSIAVEACVPDEKLIPVNDAGTPDIAEVFAASARLVSELGRPDLTELRAQRDRLLALGMGAEARALALIAGDGQVMDPVREALSYLVDSEPDPSGLFSGQLGCRNQASLWALLSPMPESDATEIDTDAILRNFATLPASLRGHLGVPMAERLAELGEAEAARMLVAGLERKQASPADELSVATAEIALRDGDPEAAARAVETVRTADAGVLPDLTAVRVDTAFARNEAVDPDTLDVAELLWRERRVDDTGPEAAHSYIRGLLSHARFDEAISVFRADPLPEEIAQAAQRDILARLARDARNVTFLKHMMPGASRDLHPQDRAQARIVAARLIENGLPDAALYHLQAQPRSPAEEERVLMARALVGLSRLPEAEEMLLGVDGQEAQELRAEIREKLGDYAYAAEAFDRLGAAGDAQRAAWLGREWDALKGADDPLLAEVAIMATTAPAPPARPQDPPRLADIDAMVTDSERIRETLGALLSRTGVEQAEPSSEF